MYLRKDAYDQIGIKGLDVLLKEGQLNLVYQNAIFRVYRINISYNAK